MQNHWLDDGGDGARARDMDAAECGVLTMPRSGRGARAERYMAIDKILDSTLPKDLLTTYGYEPSLEPVDEASSLYNNNFYHSTHYGSTDSLIEQLQRPQTGPPAQRKQPSFILKIQDEESSLLGGDGGDAGGTAEEKANIV